MSDQTTPPPDAPMTPKEAKGQAKAAKAYAKAQRPFWKKKRFIIPSALVVLIIIIVMANSSSSNKTNTTTAGATGSTSTSGTKSTLYPGRPDAQDKDTEVAIGQPAALRGRTATVTTAAYQPNISQFESDGYIVADVTILNRNSDAQPYNLFDWKIQTPNGQVVDPTFTTMDGQLASGDLVGNGTVSGKVAFKVGTDPHGQFFLIYKPDALASDRGIWGVTTP